MVRNISRKITSIVCICIMAVRRNAIIGMAGQGEAVAMPFINILHDSLRF